MYNRYVRNEHGGYTRIPVGFSEPLPERDVSIEAEERPETAPFRNAPDPSDGPSPEPPRERPAHRPLEEPPHRHGEKVSPPQELNQLLGRFLERMHLQNIDTGDLLLLLILFLLFEERADDELLIALGLLLIL